MGHARLVRDERGQVARLGGVVLGEGLALPAVVAGALAGQEPEGTVARGAELTVGPGLR